MPALIYRRLPASDTWHYRRDCRWWPVNSGYVRAKTKPKHGEFCNECQSKAKRACA